MGKPSCCFPLPSCSLTTLASAFPPKVILFIVTFGSVVRAQFSMAKCGPDFERVSGLSLVFSSQHVDGTAERPHRRLVIHGFVE